MNEFSEIPAVGAMISTNCSGVEQIDNLIAEVVELIEVGEEVLIDKVTADCPHLREQLVQLLPTLEAMANLGHLHRGNESVSVAATEPAAGILGDFRIVQEIGRGGMGVVYEAEQLSLGRRIALKVLPYAALLDNRQLTRFKNEARAAATLDHPNIVAVYAVGSERSVHFYAMQLVDGHSLAEVLTDLSSRCDPDSSSVENLEENSGDKKRAPQTLTDTKPIAAAATVPEAGTDHYFRMVAQLGSQAAKALDFAHQNGIVHRDVKPGNLLLDSEGKLWVTDFGLARIEADPGLTVTGDFLGTLRYMSPEQALAKRGIVDHRTDVYSLGATLYELLARRPAYLGMDQQELLHQIAFEEPIKLRQLDDAIPVDLETIVGKAMAKDPVDRYETAKDLADDLQRYLDCRSIHAKPPTLLKRLLNIARRRRRIAIAIAATTIAAMVLSVTTINVALQRERSLRRSAAESALQAAGEGARAKQEAIRAERHLKVALDTLDELYALLMADRVDSDVVQFVSLNENSGLTLSVARPLTKLEQSSLAHYVSFYEQTATCDRSCSLPDRESSSARIASVYSRLGMQWRAMEVYRDVLESIEHEGNARRATKPCFVAKIQCTRAMGVEMIRAGRTNAGVAAMLSVDSSIRNAESQADEDPALLWEHCQALRWLASLRSESQHYGVKYPYASSTSDTYRKALAKWRYLRTVYGTQAWSDCPDEYIFHKFGCDLQHSFSDYLAEEGRLAEAIERSQQVVEYTLQLDMRHLPGRWLSLQANSLGHFGRMLTRNGKWNDAQEVLGAAKQKWRQWRDLSYMNGGTHGYIEIQNEIARLHIRQKKTQEALKVLQEWPDWVSPTLETVKERAELLRLILKEAPSESDLWRQLVSAQPRDPVRQVLWASFLNKSGLHKLAEEGFSRAIELAPETAAYWFMRGTVRERSQRFREAVEDYERAISLDPFLPHPYNRIAWTMATCEDKSLFDPEKALAMAERAVLIMPESESFANTKGVVQYRGGLWSEAVDTIERSRELSPLNAWDTIVLAMAYARLGNKQRSDHYYGQAMQEWPYLSTASPSGVLAELMRLKREADDCRALLSREIGLNKHRNTASIRE